jgi:hypothetical protein
MLEIIPEYGFAILIIAPVAILLWLLGLLFEFLLARRWRVKTIGFRWVFGLQLSLPFLVGIFYAILPFPKGIDSFHRDYAADASFTMILLIGILLFAVAGYILLMHRPLKESTLSRKA